MDFNSLLLLILLLFCTSYGDNSDGSGNESSVSYVPCKKGWFLYGEKCYKILGLNKGLSWKQASVNCALERGHLATIESKELQDFLTNFLLMDAKTNAWIGLHDRVTETHFTWDDGSIVNFTNWDLQEPSGNNNLWDQEDCVEMRFIEPKTEIGVWNDLSCTIELPYFCQINKSEEILSPDPRFCSVEEGGGWKYLNSCYHIVTEEMSWEDAEQHCEEHFKGFLVTILNNEAEMFLNYLLLNLSRDYWIGIKMRDNVIQKWTSGWHAVYSKWDHEQKEFLENTCGLKSKQGVWTVSPCFRTLPFVCETLKYNAPALIKSSLEGWKCPDASKEWLDLGEVCYIFYTNKSLSWHEANYECVRKGGTLAIIHSELETNILRHHVINTGRLFIGLHRRLSKKAEFEWADGSEIDYLNWGDEEPNSIKEQCGEIWTDTMKWNDIPCDTKEGYICSAKKVLSNVVHVNTSASGKCSCTMPSNMTTLTRSASEYRICPSGISAKSVMGVILCTLLVAILTGIVIYYSRHFCKRKPNIFYRKYFDSCSPGSLYQVSSEVILKPEELECRM